MASMLPSSTRLNRRAYPRAGQHEAHEADRRALELTANPAEQSLLRQRISWA
ncbi:hypothetical protein [Micromonospora sp. NPDC007230]|uniref:hypothetical protein n=1 Tax=Micromonospora sp. NPDC007230 TaxID=3364237 RepID=UPI0036A95C00